MIRVAYLIRSLNVGGAERQLVTLVKGLDKNQFQPVVICYYGGGELEKELLQAGIPVISTQKRGRWDLVSFFGKLARILRDFHPQILHSYLATSNIMAGLSRIFFPSLKVIYGVRYGFVDFTKYDWSAKMSFQAEVKMSFLSNRVIVNSFAGKEIAVSKGIPGNKLLVIPNGIDIERYRPAPETGQQFRSLWKIPTNRIVFGLAGRLDPMKNHSLFVQSAALCRRAGLEAVYLCIGDGPADYRQQVINETREAGIADAFIWAGNQTDIQPAYNAMDICCLTSTGEGFPNVIGEAMACEIPCIVTRVGDAPDIVAGTGLVVDRMDPEHFSAAMREMAGLDAVRRREMGNMARRRIEEEFSAQAMIKKTEIEYNRLIS